MFCQERKVFEECGVKSNDENMIKSNDGIPSPHGGENEGRCFSG